MKCGLEGSRVYTYRLVAGDRYGDGHGMTETFKVEVSHGLEEIQDAYKLAVKKAKVALDAMTKGARYRVCVEPEDPIIPAAVVKRLNQLGIDWGFLQNEPREDGSLQVCGGEIAHLFMEMVRSQIKGFDYEFVEDKAIFIPVGIGYGCYY